MAIQGDYAPSTSERSRKQVEDYESSGGTAGTTMRGMPVIILTTVGSRTGKVRKTPLMRVEHDGRYAAIGSLGGAEKNPVWVYNVRADPHVELQDGPVRKAYVAHEAEGDERAEWWTYAVAAYPDYDDYQQRTERLIPVFVLEPVD
jgi:deazaflavin-dependent oxidoreductase (nitroreductase family)